MRCCEVDDASVFGPCWAGAVVVIVRDALVVERGQVGKVALELEVTFKQR